MVLRGEKVREADLCRMSRHWTGELGRSVSDKGRCLCKCPGSGRLMMEALKELRGRSRVSFGEGKMQG